MAIYDETHCKCDRCGKDTIKKLALYGAEIMIKPDAKLLRKYIYLCKDCTKDFKKFMKGNLNLDM